MAARVGDCKPPSLAVGAGRIFNAVAQVQREFWHNTMLAAVTCVHPGYAWQDCVVHPGILECRVAGATCRPPRARVVDWRVQPANLIFACIRRTFPALFTPLPKVTWSGACMWLGQVCAAAHHRSANHSSTKKAFTVAYEIHKPSICTLAVQVVLVAQKQH